MNGAHHTREVLHANVESRGFAEHAVVELLLVLLGVVGRVPYGISVFLVGVAAPHAVDDGLAGEEVVCVLEEHLGVADVNADLVVLALAVAVSEQTDLLLRGNHAFDFQAHFVFAVLLFLEGKRVVGIDLVVVGFCKLAGGVVRVHTV